MEDQTLEAFGQPEDVEPSNPVPPGGTPEGVKDDIDIKVSQGEYIIPEDVVRFIGVGKLEQLVTQVKSELQKMAEKGRMGSPVPQETPMDDELPFDPSELNEEAPQQPGFSTGGLVTDQTSNRVGLAPTTPNAPSTPQAGVKVYKDKTGFIRVVPYVNGQPIGTPPEGAEEIPSTPKPQTPTQQAPTILQGDGNSDRNKETDPSYDIDSLTSQEARAKLGQQEQVRGALNSTVGKAGMALAGGVVPGAGLFGAAQRSISQALADRALSLDYNEESGGLLGSLLGGTRIGNALGFTDRVDDLKNQDLVRDIRANYTPVDKKTTPSTTTGSFDRPTALAPERSPVPTARPDRTGSTSSEGNSGGGWGNDNQDTADSMSKGGMEGPGSLY